MNFLLSLIKELAASNNFMVASQIFNAKDLTRLDLSETTLIECNGLAGQLPNGIKFLLIDGAPSFEGDEGFEDSWNKLHNI